MTKEKKPQRASGTARQSSRGASKRPASSSQKTSPTRNGRARRREDKNAQKRRKTEQAVRKASARTSQRSSTGRKSSSLESAQRNTSHSRKNSNQPRAGSSPARSRNTSTRNRGASTRSTGASVRTHNSAQRTRSSQGANVRRAQPAKKRKPTAAEIARRKRNRRLLLIVVVLLLFLVAGLFTLYYVSNRIHDQTDAAVVDDSKSFAPIVCTPDILDTSMDIIAPVEEKSPITFTISLHNTSREHPCYIDVGRGNTELNITSGEDSIASLSTCENSGKEYKQLLLDRDMTSSFVVTWNRHRDRGCLVDAPIALPGMYKAVWTAKGVDGLEEESVFEIEKPPEPEPEPEESENLDTQPAEPAAETPVE